MMSDLNKAASEAIHGQLSRRDFLALAAAAGVSLTLASQLITPARAETPKRGGLVRMATAGGSTDQSLDPAVVPDTFISLVQLGIRNTLVEIQEDAQAVGELAESWDASDDAATWSFKLRKGIEFHNGKDLTTQDVVDTMNYHRGEDSKSIGKTILSEVVDIKADSDTVVFELSGGNADFPVVLSSNTLQIMPSIDGKLDFSIGTGGYTIEDLEHGVRALLKRNPNYFKGDDRAHFDEVQLLSIVDTVARTTALRTGEVDAINRVDPKTANLLSESAGVRIQETVSSTHYTFPMITTRPPFDSNDVRLALKYAVDREQLLRTVLGGYGALGNDQPIGPTYRYFAADLETRPFDPDKAKYHVKKAGLSDLKVALHTSDGAFEGAVDAAVLYSEAAKNAGISIEVVRQPADGYWSNVWMKKDWCACYWAGRPTEDWVLTATYAADANYNDTFWKHEQFNQLLVAARAERVEEKRRQMYHDLQVILSDEGGVVLPVFASHLTGLSDKIGTKQHFNGNWDMDNLRAIERWWLA